MAHKLSPASRARIIAAQRCRWAKIRWQKLADSRDAAAKPKMRDKMRKAIAAAAKARWAKAKAAAQGPVNLHPAAGFSPAEYEQLSTEQKTAAAMPKARTARQLAALVGVDLPEPCTFTANTPKTIMKTVLRNPVEVQMHWTRKLLPKPSQERVNALSTAIAQGVQLPPGYLVEPNLLVAGETRRLAHKARQIDMEFIVITEEEAMAIALGENTNRQSYKFKYQIAFVYCPLASKCVEVSTLKRVPRPEKDAKTPMNSRNGNFAEYRSLDEVAEAIGVSYRCLTDAKETYEGLLAWDAEHEPKKWGESKTKQTALDYWTGRIMDQDEPCTPGQARAGLAGSDAGADGKTKPVPKQLELFCSGFESIGKWGKSFSTFDDDQKKLALKAVKKTIAAMPADLRAELTAELKRLDREEKEGK